MVAPMQTVKSAAEIARRAQERYKLKKTVKN